MHLNELSKELNLRAADLESALQARCPGLPERLSVGRCAARLSERSSYDHYERLPRAALRMFAAVQRRYGYSAVPTYLKSLLCTMMRASINNWLSEMPCEIQDALLLHYARVINDLATQPDDYYALRQPRQSLEKDLAICGNWAIPIGGAWLVEKRLILLPRARSPVYRSIDSNNRPEAVGSVLRKPFAFLQLERMVRRVRMRFGPEPGRIKTCFIVHTAERHMRYFNAKNHRQAYLNLGKLLSRNEEVDGVYRCSWFLDPSLETISPAIQFLRAVPLQGGACFWPVGPPWKRAFRDALDKSPARKRAHAEGRYMPWLYSFYWARTDFLKWAAESESEE